MDEVLSKGGHSGKDHGNEEHPHGETRGYPGHDGQEQKAKLAIFLGLLVVFGLLVFFFLKSVPAVLANFWWVAAGIVIIYFISSYGYLLQLADFERAVIFRFGRVNRVGGPGWALAFPPLEAYTVVDLRTKTIDTPKQEVVTKDNIEVTIDAVVYLRVDKNPQSVINSVIEIDDYLNASKLFVQALLRDKAASMNLSELLSRVDDLNAIIKKELERISSKWGVVVEEAVIQDIELPKSVLDAMHGQKVAAKRSRARILLHQGA